MNMNKNKHELLKACIKHDSYEIGCPGCENGLLKEIKVGVEYQGVPLTGWRCAICFNFADVHMIDVTLCTYHAKRYNFGYGDSLKSMVDELKKSKI